VKHVYVFHKFSVKLTSAKTGTKTQIMDTDRCYPAERPNSQLVQRLFHVRRIPQTVLLELDRHPTCRQWQHQTRSKRSVFLSHPDSYGSSTETRLYSYCHSSQRCFTSSTEISLEYQTWTFGITHDAQNKKCAKIWYRKFCQIRYINNHWAAVV